MKGQGTENIADGIDVTVSCVEGEQGAVLKGLPRYRVEEVKQRLKDSKYKNFTILAIAYDSGFNSKSAFNTIFKDLTGMTPSQYLDSVSG